MPLLPTCSAVWSPATRPVDNSFVERRTVARRPRPTGVNIENFAVRIGSRDTEGRAITGEVASAFSSRLFRVVGRQSARPPGHAAVLNSRRSAGEGPARHRRG